MYAPESLLDAGQGHRGHVLAVQVRFVAAGTRAPATISVFVASSFDGTLRFPQEVDQEQQDSCRTRTYDGATWQA